MVIVIVAAYFIYNYLDNRSKEELEKAEAKKTEDAIRESVAELVKRTNAIDNWWKILSKDKNISMAPIISIELEHLWIGSRPILFVGTIKDIITDDNDNYKIKIEQSFNSRYLFIETEIILDLKCPKAKIDSFLNQHPNIFKQYGFKNGVAVVADIKKIETITMPGKEDGTSEIKIGKGNCIDIVYIGRVRF
ncbi:MAG: hypothetical protein KKF43_12950 [Proteobacteria bacterium]|nr:hypothetical protein [Pseudomonadota bacterium]